MNHKQAHTHSYTRVNDCVDHNYDYYYYWNKQKKYIIQPRKLLDTVKTHTHTSAREHTYISVIASANENKKK